MYKNIVKYHLVFLFLSWMLSITSISYADPGETCNEAVDYGLINGDDVMSGTFESNGEEYWIKFSTSCTFRDIAVSSCGSFATEDEWLDTFLEVYSDCNDFQEFNYDQLQEEPNTNWWNVDAPENLECGTSLGELSHAVLVIPTAQEQAVGVQIQPGTYYARVSSQNPAGDNDQPGDWQIAISGRAMVLPQVSDQYLELPHNPSDGAPGGAMTVELNASESICTEQIGIYEWVENWTDDNFVDSGSCDEGYVEDCSGDGDCCSEAWIGDNVADCEDQADGCDLTCYANDGGDCGPIAGPTGEVVQYTSLDYGDHYLTLNITDLMDTPYEDNFIISISEPNTAPTSDAGDDQFITIPHDGNIDTDVITVTLSGSSSIDDDGDNLLFDWEKISGPDDMALSDTFAESPTFNTFNPFGSPLKEYEFQLTVTDPYNVSHIDTTGVIIYSEENVSPTASAPNLEINILHDGDPDTFNTEEFTLNGTNSYDLDGDNIISYMWFDSELDTLSEIAYYTGTINYSSIDSVLGDHSFTLVVVDSYDAVGNTSVTLTVGPELNAAPIVEFDPPIAEFMMNPDDNPGGSQMVVLDVYNASYDPDGDEIISEWFNEDGSPALPLQNLSSGQSNFTLVVTDSYGVSSESVFVVLISEPNAVPSAITNDSEAFYESTADLNQDGLSDTLYLYGGAVDTDHTENDLGALWTLLEENSSVSILNDSSFTGSFLSEEVPHNDYPIYLDFSLTVWDPFSCYMYNTQSFEDSNDNGQWDPDESWNSFCINGQDSTTYDEAFLSVDIINYNEPPQIFPDLYAIDPIVINEDESTEISFDYNLWSANSFFSDSDDCQFDTNTNECISYDRYKCDQGNNDPSDDIYSDVLDECENLCIIDNGCKEQFSVNLINGENYTSDNAILTPDLNYFGTLSVPFQINDNNDINNLSETIILEIEVLPINDPPIIFSFNDNELIDEGVLEDSQFTINLEDLSYYDVEGDQNNDELCNEWECEYIELFLDNTENYSFVGEDIVILTQDFFGDLEIGLQIFDGEDYSDPFYITVPVEGVNDYPSLISGMDTVYFYEDFGDSTYNLGNIFTDVDGDPLSYEKIDQEGILYFNSEIPEIPGDELWMSSVPDSSGFQEIYFDVSDGIVTIEETIVFSILPVDDSPIVYSDTLSTEEYGPDYIPLEIPLKAKDIDSEDVYFEIVDYPEHGTVPPNSIEYIDSEDEFIRAVIDYTPYEGYRCADSLTYRANDNNSYSEVETIIINVGNCNQAPELVINLSSSINIPEDSPIYFIQNYEGLGWCLDDDDEWDQVNEYECDNGSFQWELPDYYIPLNDIDYFEVIDQDEDESFIEIWESDYYYIEDGYCASSSSSNDWYINTEVSCGLISPNESCLSAPAIETGYDDGYMYCPCDAGETCTASQKFISNDGINGVLSIRPIKDYDLPFDIVMIANDDNLTYNLSPEQYVSVIINPINDPPIIGQIEDQEIDEGGVLELNYSSNEPDFTIYDIDSEQLEISQDSSPSVIFMITNENEEDHGYDCPDSTLCLKTIDSNWNGYAQIYVTLEDNDISNPGYDISQFTLTVNQIDDEPQFTDLTVEDSGENLITLLEDTNPVTYDENDNPILFAREIKIYYTDNDWDPEINDNPDDEFIPNDISLMIESASVDPKIIFSPYLNPNPLTDPITNELYYSQLIVLDEIVEEHWNGTDGINFTVNGETTFFLEVMVTPQNDAPYDINQISSDIVSYNQNSYDWDNSPIEIDICQNSETQGIYNSSSGECEISNFYLDSDGVKHYRLPYRRYPSTELLESDLVTFKWMLTDDIDRNYGDVDIFYRVELIDSLLNRAIVLQDFISHADFEDSGQTVAQVDIDVNQLFFSYNLDFNYFDYCEYTEDLTLSDISDLYLDLTGNTRYTWRVLANNGQDCDELNLDPNSTFISCGNVEGEQTCDNLHYCEWLINAEHYECASQYVCDNSDEIYLSFDDCEFACSSSECSIKNYDNLDNCNAGGCEDCYQVVDDEFCSLNNGNDFYIDIVPPIASMSISQNEMAPDFMELYLSFDEFIDPSKSQLFIENESSSDGYSLSNLEGNQENNVYSLTCPFPSTGVVKFDIESWDEVGNGLITSRSITYEEIASSNSSNILSPDGVVLIQFNEGDIESDASLLIQKVNEENSDYRLDIQKVSDIYNISSVNMNIIDDVDIEFIIPNDFNSVDHWKFRIIQEGNDITSFSKDGIVYGKLTKLGSIALYYSPSTEFSIPDDIELVGNYPNPFNPSTRIYYIVDQSDSPIRISILDLLGREVRVLYDGISNVGYYELNWDGTNDGGYQLGSGIYFINARIGDEQLYKKVMKLK